MTKKFLFILDPLTGLNVRTDTSLALMEESASRGIKTFACELKDIFLKNGQLYFLAAEVKLASGYVEPPAHSKPEAFSSDDFAAVFMRKDPPVDENFIASLYMLRCFDPKKTLMVNHPDGLLLANEKLFGQKIAARFFAPTIVSVDRDLLKQFVNEHEKVVIKPLFGSGGAGVLVVEKGDRNFASMLELLSQNFNRPIMMQSYIKDARLGDKRIILVGGEAKGAINRVPSAFDHRANFHAGGSAESCLITKREEEIIDAIRPELKNLGLHLVGIDVIAGFLSEINVTSPTCVLEIESSEGRGLKLRAKIIDYVQECLP